MQMNGSSGRFDLLWISSTWMMELCLLSTLEV